MQKTIFFSGPLAVAVSGGPDSMALCHYLLHTYPHPIVALTVDHQLRAESSKEAKKVHQWLGIWGVDHHILTWNHEISSPLTRLQEKAREARYELLGQWCETREIPFLATAHHRLDQAETIVMRLMKGSGANGLRGMAPLASRSWGTIVRPFLHWSREEIDTYVKKHQIPHVVDPSNMQDRFERVRWRRYLQQSDALRHGLTEDTLIALAEKMQGISVQPSQDIQPHTTERLVVYHDINALSRAIQQVGQKHYPPAVKSLERVFDALHNGKIQTLGGCLLSPKHQGIRVVPEFRLGPLKP